MFLSSFRFSSFYRKTCYAKVLPSVLDNLTSKSQVTCLAVRNVVSHRQRKRERRKEILVAPPVFPTQDTDKEEKVYKIVQPKTSTLTTMLVAVKSRRERYKKKIILLEGKRLISEALKANIEPVMILFSRKNLINDLPLNARYCNTDHTVLHQLPYKEIKLWSDLTTSPGIFGIFKMPNLEKHRSETEPLPITIVCDNIREPGNLGSILRVAASIPVERVVLLTGCSDIWDPKVIRGSSGAMFYLNVSNNSTWEEVNDSCSGEVILADHLTNNQSSGENIPIPAELIETDPEALYDDDDNDSNAEAKQNLRDVFQLPLKSYCELNYAHDKNYVVIVGGETQGLSEQAFEFAVKRNGYRVHIPLAGYTNSLNAATAFGIISFEMRRQITASSS